MISPFDVDTGSKLVTSQNVGRYLAHRDSWEGSSFAALVITPPNKITP